MGYYAIAQMSQDADLTARESACAAQEVPGVDPYGWTIARTLTLASQPGWDAAWSSALAGGNEHPGRDESVITDGMILAAVQAISADPA